MVDAVPPVVLPEEAIRYFRAKGLQLGFDWRDVWQDEHVRGFTVAKVMSVDLLQDIRAAVDKALAEGQTLAQFRKALRPTLMAKGWWGKALMVDPATGEEKLVQLGSPRREKIIFDVNMRTAYQAGRWERIQRSKALLPYLRYMSVMDGRERPEHHAWHNTILPIDHSWWDTHYPPCGWGCRCTAVAVNQRMIDRLGLKVSEELADFPVTEYVNRRTGEVTEIERGIDPGWSYNVGKAALDGLAPKPMGVRKSFLQGLKEGILGDDGALQSSSAMPEKLLKSFFASFEMAADKGQVWKDVTGWPIALTPAMFADLRLQASELSAMASVLRNPEQIRLRWLKALDGSYILVRRYIAAAGVFDLGSKGWRFVRGPQPRLQTGDLIWTREAGDIAAYNPHQPRDRLGRFSSSGGGAIIFVSSVSAGTAINDRHDLGPVGVAGVSRLDDLGLSGVDPKGKPKAITLDKSTVGHILKRHGSDHRGQKPVYATDIAKAHDILNHGTINHGTPKLARNGAPQIYATARIGTHDYEAAYEVRKWTIALKSLRKK